MFLKMVAFVSALSFLNIFSMPVYNKDDRFSYLNTKNPLIKKMAPSVAALVPKDLLKSSKGYYSINALTLGRSRSLCSDERFFNEVAGSDCTAFLISEDIVVTAGHCMQERDSCQKLSVIFEWDGGTIYPDQMYSCQSVLEYAQTDDLDYAVIKLDRKVEGRRPLPLQIRSRKVKVSSKAHFFVLGHPSGIPLKAALNASMLDNRDLYSFLIDADTFAGNSGSPVFHSSSGKVEGILVSGEEDYAYDATNKCWRVKVCTLKDDCRGEKVIRLSSFMTK